MSLNRHIHAKQYTYYMRLFTLTLHVPMMQGGGELTVRPCGKTKDVKLKFFHNRSSNRYNRLKTGHRFHLCCRLRGGGRNRQILFRETCSISIGLVAGIRSPPLNSVACLCSQVAIEFGLGRRIRGDAGTINFNDVADIRHAGARAKLCPCSAPVGGWKR